VPFGFECEPLLLLPPPQEQMNNSNTSGSIHCARAVLLRVKYDTGRLGYWAHQSILKWQMQASYLLGTLAPELQWL
jgi:hypothetical protein